MKTKITLLLTSIALITLSFTFANVEIKVETSSELPKQSVSTPVGGMLADEVVK